MMAEVNEPRPSSSSDRSFIFADTIIKPNHEAIVYLEEIVPEEDFRYIMFDDNLITVSDTGKELGEFNVTVEPTRYKGLECFLIHANSNGSVDGVPCGTSIVCYVSKCLETLEQYQHEYMKLDSCPLDRKAYLYRQRDCYLLNRVITQGEDVQKTTKTFALEQMRGFISEGSNFLLQRLLIDKGMDKSLTFVSLDSDGSLCPAVYNQLYQRIQVVQNNELRVNGLERTVYPVSATLLSSWQSYFLSDGHLTSLVQVGSPVIMKVLIVPNQIEREEEAPKSAFDKRHLNWQDDMQLHSLYIDRKEELRYDHATFMRHHPELRALLADFLQFLLFRKPEDVIAFAADYFCPFSLSQPDRPPYLASNELNPFPDSHTNNQINELRNPMR